jgi:hypothetical protein
MTAAVASSSECSQRLLFRVGAHTLAVDVCDDLASTVLESTYALLRCESAHTPTCTVQMRRLSDSRLSVRFGKSGSPAVSVCRGDVRSAYHAARELFVRCASTQAGAVAFYGALVAGERGGLLLLGPAAVGKSVLALHMAQQGATFLGDETVLLNLRSAEVSALPRRPSLRESAIGVLPDSLRDRVSNAKRVFQTESGRFWYALDEDELGFAPSSRSVPLRAIFILRERRDDFYAHALDLGDALAQIAQRAYARPVELAEFAALRHALRGVACYEVGLGAPGVTASALLGLGACA